MNREHAHVMMCTTHNTKTEENGRHPTNQAPRHPFLATVGEQLEAGEQTFVIDNGHDNNLYPYASCFRGK